MADPAALPGWVIPVAVAFGAVVIAVAILIWMVRRARRSVRARARAEAARLRAGAVLVRLDDAVDELDLETALSGALHGSSAPSGLRRARMTAQHARDRAFAQFDELSRPGLHPADVRWRAARIETSAAAAVTDVGRARGIHGAWVGAHVSTARQLAQARERLAEVRRTIGDPDVLVSELSAKFDRSEWQDAAAAASDARADADEAQRLLDGADGAASDPSRTAVADLAAAERALRRASVQSRTLEETHRVVTQASEALPGEFESIHQALRQAAATAGRLPSDAADRLGTEVRAIEESVAALQADATRRPTAAVDAIARLRHRLDVAVGDTRTAQQQVRGARTALPGTLAAARGAISLAESAALRTRTGADARVRLADAQRELAASRNATDPITALGAARRAIASAEGARALAERDRDATG